VTRIDHIVFDIGQVLLHWDPDYIYHDLIPNPEERAQFLKNICSLAWNLEQDRGRDWRLAEDLLIRDYPEKAELIRAYKRDWLKSVPHAYSDVVEVFQELIDQGKDVTLLTNFNQDTYLEAKDKFTFLSEARGEKVSGRIKMVKPDRAIYHHHQNQFSLTPEKTLFIDDTIANIEAARSVGWHGIHFAGRNGAAKLRSELEQYSI